MNRHLLPKRLCHLFAVSLVLGSSSWAFADTVCSRFVPVSPNPSSKTLNGVTVGGDTVVAVGDHGTVIIGPASQEGFTWRLASTPTESNLLDVVQSGGDFVAVGDGGTILLSQDGNEWVEVSDPADAIWNSVASNGQVVLAVGDDGRIVGSTNLQVWSEYSSGTTRDLEAVAWDGQEFIAVGEQGVILQSADGVHWTAQISPTDRRFSGIACRMNHCVAVTRSADIFSRDDEMRWTVEGVDAYVEDLRGIDWCHDRFVAVGRYGNQAASYDGVEWWPIGNGLESSSLYDVVYAGGRLLAVGLGGQILGSTDQGESWQLSNAIADVPIRTGILTDGGAAVAGGNTNWFGAGQIVTTSNRRDWDLQFYGRLQPVNDIAFHMGRYLALTRIQEIGGTWEILESYDGEIWRVLSIDNVLFEEIEPSNIETTEEGFLIAASQSTIGASTYGDVWQLSSLEDGEEGTFESIATNGTIYVAVGWTTVPNARGIVATAGNDLQLTRQSIAQVPPLEAVAWGDQRFVAVGGVGTILVSSDGREWAKTASHTEESLFSVRWVGNGFVAVGRNGTYLTSPTGVLWTGHDVGITADLYDVFGTKEDFFVVGDNGLLLRASCRLRADAPVPPLK